MNVRTRVANGLATIGGLFINLTHHRASCLTTHCAALAEHKKQLLGRLINTLFVELGSPCLSDVDSLTNVVPWLDFGVVADVANWSNMVDDEGRLRRRRGATTFPWR